MSTTQTLKLIIEQCSDLLDQVQALEQQVASLQRACDAANARADKAKHTCACCEVDSSFVQMADKRWDDTEQAHEAAYQQNLYDAGKPSGKVWHPQQLQAVEKVLRDSPRAKGDWAVVQLKPKDEPLEEKVRRYLGIKPYDTHANLVKNDAKYLKQLDAQYGSVPVDLMIAKLRGV